jgi:hypothetical protein
MKIKKDTWELSTEDSVSLSWPIKNDEKQKGFLIYYSSLKSEIKGVFHQ